MTADIAIITISMVSGMGNFTTFPSILNDGRSDGTEPKSTTKSTAAKKANTEYLARGLSLLSSSNAF